MKGPTLNINKKSDPLRDFIAVIMNEKPLESEKGTSPNILKRTQSVDKKSVIKSKPKGRHSVKQKQDYSALNNSVLASFVQFSTSRSVNQRQSNPVSRTRKRIISAAKVSRRELSSRFPSESCTKKSQAGLFFIPKLVADSRRLKTRASPKPLVSIDLTDAALGPDSNKYRDIPGQLKRRRMQHLPKRAASSEKRDQVPHDGNDLYNITRKVQILTNQHSKNAGIIREKAHKSEVLSLSAYFKRYPDGPASDEKVEELCFNLSNIGLGSIKRKRQRANDDASDDSTLKTSHLHAKKVTTIDHSIDTILAKEKTPIVESQDEPVLRSFLTVPGFICEETTTCDKPKMTTKTKQRVAIDCEKNATRSDPGNQKKTFRKEKQVKKSGEKTQPDAPEKITKTRKNRKRKNNSDGKPKQPLSAYNYFFKDQRKIILASLDNSPNPTSSLHATFTAEGKPGSIVDATSPNCLYQNNDNETTHSKAPTTEIPVCKIKVSAGDNAAPEGNLTRGDEKQGTPKKRKRGRPRGPNYAKPKSPHRKISFQQLAKMIGARWKILTPDISADFFARAKLDRERYDREIAVFQEKKKKEEVVIFYPRNTQNDP